MPCILVPITADDCTDSAGGIKESYITDCANIQSVTFDANNQITAFTMASTGLWTHFVYDNDDTAKYDQVGSRPSIKKHIYDSEAFMKFEGLSNAKAQAADALTSCCCLVGIHFLNNGTAIVQGIMKSTDTGNFTTVKKKGTLTASLLTDTGANSDRAEFKLISQSTKYSHFTTLTSTQIAAL